MFLNIKDIEAVNKAVSERSTCAFPLLIVQTSLPLTQRSLEHFSNEFPASLVCNNINIAAAETWFHEDILDSFISVDGYEILVITGNQRVVQLTVE